MIREWRRNAITYSEFKKDRRRMLAENRNARRVKRSNQLAWAYQVIEKCDGTHEHCECCPFSLWEDVGCDCLFAYASPSEWDLHLIADRKTWPEDEDV